MAEASKGFEIALDTTRNILRTRAWGFWDVELAKTFQDAMKERMRSIGVNGNDWYALVDLRDFYPRSGSVQRIISQEIDYVELKGIKKIGYLGKQSYIQLQLHRVFDDDEIRQCGFFESEPEAITWLLNDLEDTREERNGSEKRVHKNISIAPSTRTGTGTGTGNDYHGKAI